MKALEDFLRPAQEGLFKRLCEKFKGNAVIKKSSFLLVSGDAPTLLIAHLDTVHKERVRTICQSENGNILMSPQGIGGDDRCGVYGICKVYEASDKKPWLLFTCDEEIGGRGAEAFCTAYLKGSLPKELDDLKILIELDRKGKNDAVYYGCDNPEFEKYITGKGFQTARGSFSDISIIAPDLGVAAVNLSCGYYNAHTVHEYINRKQLKSTIKKVVDMVSDAAKEDFPKYEYIAAYDGVCYWDALYGGWYSPCGQANQMEAAEIPKNLPDNYKGLYEELLDLYAPSELEYYRKRYGNTAIRELYEYEYGMG